jgi:hypothetical protein
MHLHVPVFERKHVPTNMHSLNTLHIQAELKQQNVRLLMAFIRRKIWLEIS